MPPALSITDVQLTFHIMICKLPLTHREAAILSGMPESYIQGLPAVTLPDLPERAKERIKLMVDIHGMLSNMPGYVDGYHWMNEVNTHFGGKTPKTYLLTAYETVGAMEDVIRVLSFKLSPCWA